MPTGIVEHSIARKVVALEDLAKQLKTKFEIKIIKKKDLYYELIEMRRDLTKIWLHFRDVPKSRRINFLITSAQAAIREIKSDKNPEANFDRLITHLNDLSLAIGVWERREVARTA